MTEVPWVRCCVCGGVCVLAVCWREMHCADRRSYLCLQIGCMSHGARGAERRPAAGWRLPAMAAKSLSCLIFPASRNKAVRKRSPVNYRSTPDYSQLLRSLRRVGKSVDSIIPKEARSFNSDNLLPYWFGRNRRGDLFLHTAVELLMTYQRGLHLLGSDE